jgi:cyclic-di-AMP phosphodiesterase PgpH
MKQAPFFQCLTQRLTEWQRRYKALRRLRLSKTVPIQQRKQSSFRFSVESAKKKNRICAVRLGHMPQRSPVIFAIAVLLLTGVMGHKLYNQPQLKINTNAPLTIKAPFPASIENKGKTEQHRKAASKSSIPVLMVDRRMNEKIDRNLEELLEQGNDIRVSVGSFPFFDTIVLSFATQRYLRSTSEQEWQAVQLALANTTKPKLGLLAKKENSKTSDFRLQSQNGDFTQALAELETYRFTTSQQNLSSLLLQISVVRQGYAKARDKLSQMIVAKPETVYDENSLLNLSDEDWAKTQTGIQQSLERILTQGIPPGLPQNILENAVSLQVQTVVPKEAEPLAIKLLLSIVKPNLKKDEGQTKQEAAQAASEVKPVMEEVFKGEVIVRKGEKITAWDFDVLEHYHLIRRGVDRLGLLHLGSLVTVAVGIFAVLERRIKCRLRQSDRILILLLTLSTPLVLTLGTPYTTWSAVSLLLGSFYGSALSVTVVALLLILLPISLEVSKIAVVAGAAGAIVGSCMAHRLRSREELALLGVAIALTEGGVYLIFKLIVTAAFGSVSYAVLCEAGLFGLSALIWSILALGLSSYLEQLFDLVTPSRLAELANPNRPLLKRLASEAPGTFQHTLFVSSLAEAAAKQLKCNVELVRAGTLYHDIGKMHDPLGFIENQMGKPNKHDTEINDPWKSARIIKKHVSEGIVMARKHRLPTAIQAFIPEHQGTMLIAYFYHAAQQMAQENPRLKIDEADFRYDGPIPQSRETGIVMLADSCEAALRSLKDATPEKALIMINNILRGKWQDNQLVDSGLTREEMTKIAQIFVEVWEQFHHKRIAYPKSKVNN